MNALSQLLARFTFLRCMALLGLMLGSITPALAAKIKLQTLRQLWQLVENK